ncbi:MAG: hypothetical protein WBC26_04615 [Alphaproteobacteria bacterium]|nr:hypothetical protein [Alphaproteobacteria bacterium]
MQNKYFRKIGRALGGLAVFIFMGTFPALAQPQPFENNEEATLQQQNQTAPVPDPAAIPEIVHQIDPKIESMGFSPREDHRSLGADLFRGSTRSAITELIKAQPDASSSPAMHKLVNQVLLTAASTSELVADTVPNPGEDLLTLRMEKMLDRGLYEEAASFYSNLDQDPYHERFAAAGITALIMTGKKALACVEVKTFFGDRNDSTLWKNLNLYCRYVMASAESPQKFDLDSSDTSIFQVLRNIVTTPGYTLNYTPSVFETLSPVDRAILVAENRLVYSAQTDAVDLSVPANHIQPLLNVPALDMDTRLKLLDRGVQTGTLPGTAIAGFYKSAVIDDKAVGPVQDLIRIYKKIKTADETTDIPPLLKEAIRLSASYGPATLIPFLPEIEDTRSQPLEAQELEKVLLSELLANREVSYDWLLSVATPETSTLSTDNPIYKRLLIIGYLLGSPESRTPKNTAEILDIVAQHNPAQKEALRSIIENIDKEPPSLNNGAKVYENGFDTAGNTGYTLPSAEKIERLAGASQKNAIGETILLSNLVLSTASAETPSPDALIAVTDSMKRIGLYDKSLSLTAESVLAAVK